MTVKNFKSFKGEQKVGPFNHLTTLIGPNGAGKSCVLKAISYCLALKSEEAVKEAPFIRNKECKPNDPVAVEICFKTRLSDNCFLKRTSPGKDREDIFAINGRNVSKADYRQYVTDSKLDVHMGIFVYSQGFSDTLIMKKPTELRILFEKVSQSWEFQSNCEELESEIKKYTEDFDKLGEDLKNLNKQKKLIATQLSNSDVYNKMSSNYEKLELDQILSVLLDLDVRIHECSHKTAEIQKKVSAAQKEHDRLSKELKANLDERRGVNDNSESLEAEFNQKQQELAYTREKRIGLELAAKNLQSIQSSLQSSLKELTNRQADLQAEKNTIGKAIELLTQELTKLQTPDKLPANLSSHFTALWQATAELQREEKEEFGLGEEERKVNAHVERTNREHKGLELELRDARASVSAVEGRLKHKKEGVSGEKKMLQGYEREYAAVLESLANMAEAQRVADAKRGELNDVVIGIEKLKARLGDEAENDDLLKKLYSNVDGFRGELGPLIRPVHERYQPALNIALGKAKKYLIVKDQKAAALVSEILKEKFISRTVVILDNVPEVSNKEISSFRNEVGQLGATAYDIAELDRINADIEPCLRYFLRNKAVCETSEKASKLRQLLGKKAFVITISGEVLRSNYMVSEGDSGNQSEEQATRAHIRIKLDELKSKKERIEEEIKKAPGAEEVQNADLLKDRISSLKTSIQHKELEIESMNSEKERLNREVHLKSKTL